MSVDISILSNLSFCFCTISSGIGILMISSKSLISPLSGHLFKFSREIVRLNLLVFFHTSSTVYGNNSKHFCIFLRLYFDDFNKIDLSFFYLKNNTKYWHLLGKLGNIVDGFDSFHIHVVFPFDPIFPYTNLTIEIKGLVCLIAPSSIQVIIDTIYFNSIAIFILGSLQLRS